MEIHVMIALRAIILLAVLSTASFAQQQATTALPFYVRLVQEYKYPGTELVSSAGMIEQVVSVDADTYTLATTSGGTVKIPKSLVNPVSDREAANGLLAERATHDAQMQQAINVLQQLQTERQQMLQVIQAAIAARQQQSSGASATQIRDELKALRDIQELMKNRRR